MTGIPTLPPETFGLRHPTAQELKALALELEPGELFWDSELLARYGSDETEDYCFLPDAVCRPSSVESVQRLLAWAHARRVPVVPRGAGTGLSGGALPVCGGVVLSVERLNRIREVDRTNLCVIAEAGVIVGELQQRVAELGLFYPPDPASRDSCFLAGNLAEDSAGPRSLLYGTTRRWVLGLEIVTATGERLQVGSKVRKDATGYSLVQLLIGSEGTLAVFTAATLRLIPLPRASLTLLVPFESLQGAARAVEVILERHGNVAACELMEREALEAVHRLEPLPASLRGAEAVLFFELHGDTQDILLEIAQDCEEQSRMLGSTALFVATNPAEERRLWQVRRRVGEAVKAIGPYKEADTVVPRSRLVDLIGEARRVAARYGLRAVLYGHAGDGNLHVNILKGDHPPEEWNERRDQAERELFEAVLSLGGRLTGEHGVGFTQRGLLGLALSSAEIELQRQIKRVFDPHGILNPGKIFPTS